MLTINRIREHWQSAEVERLRRQIGEMQRHIEALQAELELTRGNAPVCEEEFVPCGWEDWSL